jgi:site-specific recombinase XerD
MSNSVAARPEGNAAMPPHTHAQPAGLYSTDGARKYLNLSERTALLSQLASLETARRLFILTLMWTGARVSEVLELTAGSFQITAGLVAIRTLKRRRFCVREIPVPPALLDELEIHFGLWKRQADPVLTRTCLWPFHRVTAWRIINTAMQRAGIHGVRATPRGLRHAFGVGTLAAGVPLNIVQRLLGHSDIRTTTIYTEAAGPEEHAFAARFWNYSG